MTIKEYRDKLINDGRLGELPFVEITKSVWSDAACCGYCIDAAERLGLSKKSTAKLINALLLSFDNETIEDAETIYKKWVKAV